MLKMVGVMFGPIILAFGIAMGVGWLLHFTVGEWAGWFSFPLVILLYLGLTLFPLLIGKSS